MVSTKTLLQWLIVFVSLDIIITTVDVGFRGAIELNPLAHILGFWGFMISKVIISVFAVYVLHDHISKNHRETRVAVYALLGLYVTVFAFNMVQHIYQFIGAVA